MWMTAFVEVTYRGLELSQRARFEETGPGAGFLEHETPLPVGSCLVIQLEDGPREVQVTGVVEQEAGAKSPPGMRLAWAVAEAEPAPEQVEAESEAEEAGASTSASPVSEGGGRRRRKKRNTHAGKA